MAETKPGNKILRVLILDESPDDAEQASAALRQAGYMLKTQRLETGVAVEQNLDSNQWDLILCAHGLANLPARQVVELAARKQPFTTVIVLARRIADNELHQLMQAGARDVIIKGQWGRLLPAVERELAVASERRAWIETREALRQLESRYRSMIEASLESISYVQDGMHMDANPSYLKLFGYENIELLKETPLLNLIDKQDQARFKAALRKPEGAEKTQEFLAVTASGTRIPLEVAMTPLTISGEPCVQVVATDVSKRKALEVKLQSMHQRDPLTGLSNRTHFLGALGDVLKVPGGMLIGLTVNQLAALNQTLGHTACDRLLVQIARQLRELAGAQTPVARITGGQFAVLLDAKAATGAETLAKKLDDLFATLTANEGDRTVKPDVTIQQLRLDAQHKDRQAVMDQVFKTEIQPAPAAVTPPPARASVTPTAPAAPAVVAQHHTPALEPVAPRATGNWSEAVQSALAHNQMQLLFQPIINLHGEPRCFYEAQLMLRTLDGKVIPSAEYLPSAEAAGLGGKIDRTLMLNVIDTLSKYHLEGRPGMVFVGLSSTAVQDSALLAAIQMHMKATGLDPSNLILQLDEAVLVQHLEAARSFIEKARAMGMGVAVDNFTGQAVSLEVLAGIHIDFFGVNCGPNGLTEDTLATAIDAGLALDRMILAKNIEDADIFTALFSRGVHYVQGDYLQPASPGLDYSFEAEQTLASDEPLAPSWRVAG
ncbi:MAG TPA: EAL domain-containing protein [Acidiferrobacterales bacterium]|nr:EAL domain-containing protein [Acidiferrobacterales bacterium]